MIGFTDEHFLNSYIKEVKDKTTGAMKPKIQDNFQTGEQKLFPFTTNPNANMFDGTCGLKGVAGEFYRRKNNLSVQPIYSPQDTESVIRSGLKEQFKMPDGDIDRFIKVFNDVMFENETLNVIDMSFFGFVPMKYTDESSKDYNENYAKKYRSGQSKIADYYTSIASLCEEASADKKRNLFCEIINTCLQNDTFTGAKKYDQYFVLPFIAKAFKEDYHWLMKQSSSVVVKSLPLLLYFYASYSLMQTLMFMNHRNWDHPIDEPIVVTYMLSSERASQGMPAVKRGWAAADHLAEPFLNKMSSYAQALDILNLMFDEEPDFMIFQEILARFDEMSFDEEAKQICVNVLDSYQYYKRELLKERSTETSILPDSMDVQVGSYREFVDKLLRLCKDLQSKDYPRMKRSLYSLMNIKLHEKRREHDVLVLDEDMLLLLVTMIVKDERILIEDFFHRFRDYGIEFSLPTKNAISDYLLKLNLLERKSDSGEAQYVRVIL